MKSKFMLALLPLLAVLVLASGMDAQCSGCNEKEAACSKAKPNGTITTGALVALLKAKVPVTVIDARAKVENRIPGAKVLSEVNKETLGSKTSLIVTYCSGPKCNRSTKVAAKLRGAGYTNVIEYKGGFAAWEKTAAACGSACSTKKSTDGCKDGATGGCSSKSAAAASSCNGCSSKTKKATTGLISRVDTNGLKAMLDAKIPLVLLDARTGKYDDGIRIPGAVAIKDCSGKCWEKTSTYKNLVKNKNALVVTYCGATQCPLSAQLATKLRTAGYTNVIEYKAGISSWKKTGFKTVAKEAGHCCGDKDSGDCSGGCSEKKVPAKKVTPPAGGC